MGVTSRPVAVIISDIHFNLNNLSLATTALKSALKKADHLSVPLIIAGDLNDTKAIIRGEVANRLVELFEQFETVKTIILVGNHDLLNEKETAHSLNFLNHYVHLVSYPLEMNQFCFIPYQTDKNKFLQIIKQMPTNKTIICHQGFLGAHMGDYIQDKSSVDPAQVSEYKIISGHYHRHQTVGSVTYIGSPYTVTRGEANDGSKGFLILNEDGSYIRNILPLRKHVTMDLHVDYLIPYTFINCDPKDLLLLKVRGTTSELRQINKQELGTRLLGHTNFQLELLPTKEIAQSMDISNMTDSVIFDKIISNLPDTEEEKIQLKILWKDLYEA